MLDKSEVKAFLRFTEEAADAELQDKAAFYLEAISLLEEGDMKADYRFMLRLVRQEQIARAALARSTAAAKQRDDERRRSGTF